MGKKSRVRARQTTSSAVGHAETGPRQPCPCGSGRRYKACHGSPGGAATPYVARPFAGVAGECDLVAMREFVPSATAPLRLAGDEGDRTVQLCSLLPMAAPALVREDGSIWLGLQVQHLYGDPGRDLAAVLQQALDAEAGAGLARPPRVTRAEAETTRAVAVRRTRPAVRERGVRRVVLTRWLIGLSLRHSPRSGQLRQTLAHLARVGTLLGALV